MAKFTMDNRPKVAILEIGETDHIRQELENTERQLISSLVHIWRVLGKRKRVAEWKEGRWQ